MEEGRWEMGDGIAGLRDYETTGLRDYETTALRDYETTRLRDYETTGSALPFAPCALRLAPGALRLAPCARLGTRTGTERSSRSCTARK